MIEKVARTMAEVEELAGKFGENTARNLTLYKDLGNAVIFHTRPVKRDAVFIILKPYSSPDDILETPEGKALSDKEKSLWSVLESLYLKYASERGKEAIAEIDDSIRACNDLNEKLFRGELDGLTQKQKISRVKECRKRKESALWNYANLISEENEACSR